MSFPVVITISSFFNSLYPLSIYFCTVIHVPDTFNILDSLLHLRLYLNVSFSQEMLHNLLTCFLAIKWSLPGSLYDPLTLPSVVLDKQDTLILLTFQKCHSNEFPVLYTRRFNLLEDLVNISVAIRYEKNAFVYKSVLPP